MTRIKYLYPAAAIVISMVGCKNIQEPEIMTIAIEQTDKIDNADKILNPNVSYAKVEFGIDGMTCAMGCAKTIEKKVAKMDGVKSAKVDFEKELAMVEYDETIVTLESLEATVSKAGSVYKVKDMKQVEEFSSEK